MSQVIEDAKIRYKIQGSTKDSVIRKSCLKSYLIDYEIWIFINEQQISNINLYLYPFILKLKLQAEKKDILIIY